jgi:hypothetical protein
MRQYLKEFGRDIETKWKGSLVKVARIGKPHAKEYLNQLAKDGVIEKVTWGWYWIPSNVKNTRDFLRKDKNFKVISDQTAASFWNGDFIHRDIYIVKVRDRSYARALEKFGAKKGWQIHAEYTNETIDYKKINGLFVESLEQTVMDCLRNHAFEDAFATLYFNKDSIDVEKMEQKYYWDRLPHSKIRLRQILEYYWARVIGRHYRDIEDGYIKRNVDDALEKVIAFG